MTTEIPAPVPSSSVTHWSDEVDVLVVGAGMAGACAALEAARGGASVLVVDQGATTSAARCRPTPALPADV